MNAIIRKKNGGTLLIEPLARGYDDLVDGDEYVHLGKHHRVLIWGSIESDDERIGKVIWDYNVKDRERVVNKFQENGYREFKQYVGMITTTYTGLMSKARHAKKIHGTDVVNVTIIR